MLYAHKLCTLHVYVFEQLKSLKFNGTYYDVVRSLHVLKFSMRSNDRTNIFL